MNFLRRMLRDPVSWATGRSRLGYIDRVADGIVEGWAMDRTLRGPLSVDIEADGEVIARGVVADGFRADLFEAGIGSGHHGFALPLGDTLPEKLRLLAPGGQVIAVFDHRASGPAAAPDDGTTGAEEIAAQADQVRDRFDAAHYLAQFGAEAPPPADDPLHHYMTEGWRQGFDPSPEFSTRHYLTANPDVAQAGVNPFWHFVVAGERERRVARPVERPAVARLAALRRLPDIRRKWRKQGTPPDPMAADDIAAAIVRAAAGGGENAPLILCLTHDDYTQSAGGIQLCAGVEAREAAGAGAAHLAVYPWQPLPTLAEDDETGPYMLILNGTPLGATDEAGLCAVLSRAADDGAAVALAIHSLLGHAPEAVLRMARAARTGTALFWLHDHLSLCPGFTLLRNDVTHCGAPPPASAACGICIYGAERPRHLDRMRALFGALDITAVAPSEFQAGFWRSRSDLPVSGVTILPHTRFGAPRAAAAGPPPDAPLKIAYLGWPAYHKGWAVFLSLVERMQGDGAADFHYFGSAGDIDPRLTAHHVTIEPDNPHAMRDAVAGAGIDVVLHWSRCAETYSLTTHEAIAAGAMVVTSPVSGNIAAVAETLPEVVVHDDPATLAEALTTGALAEAVRARRAAGRHLRDLTFSAMSLDAIAGGTGP